MNIQKSFEAILKKYGHDAIYIRKDTRFQCDCYLERNGEANPLCKECFGLGHPVSLEKIRVRHVIDSNIQREAILRANDKEGVSTPTQYEYFIEKDVHPRNGDLIFEVILDEAGKVQKITNKSIISLAHPLRGSSGRIEFYQVYARYKRMDRHDDKTISDRTIQTKQSDL